MNFSCFFAVGSSSSASSDCSLLLLVVNEWLFYSGCLEPPNGVNGASKRPFWRLQTPRTLPPVSPLLWFRHAPLGEHPLVIPPFLRGYRGGYCSPCRRHDFHDAEFAVLSHLDDIDGRIRSTKVLIKQKSLGKDTPTIFGAVFESTLNPETRRSGGMHYTSIENIHKVTHCS